MGLTTAAVLIPGAVAQAAIEKVGSTYEYTRGDGGGTLTIYYCAPGGTCVPDYWGSYYFLDTGNAPVGGAGSGCTVPNSQVAYCASAGITRVVVRSGTGNDSIATTDGAEAWTIPVTLDGGAGNDSLTSTAFADVLSGGAGDDTIGAGAGDDHIAGGLGADTLAGGPDTDVADYSDHSAPVRLTLPFGGTPTSGSSEDGPAGARDTINADVENVIGGAAGDYIDASAADGPLVIDGGLGGDMILGGAGTNTITGGAGSDDITGGSGADTIEGGDGADRINGRDGADALHGGAGADTIEARDDSADSVDCGADDDTAWTDSLDSRATCELPAPPQTSATTSSGSEATSGAATTTASTPPTSPSAGAPQAPASAPAPVCRVPKLMGLTLAKAKAALKKRHCALGKVSKKKPKKQVRQGTVTSQSVKPSATKRAGTKIALVLAK